MKTKTISFFVSITAVIAIFVITCIKINDLKVNASEKANSSYETAEKYLIKETEDGYIGVYFNDTGDLIETYGIYVNSLPEYDREILKEGFTVEGKSALRSAIEDYTG